MLPIIVKNKGYLKTINELAFVQFKSQKFMNRVLDSNVVLGYGTLVLIYKKQDE